MAMSVIQRAAPSDGIQSIFEGEEIAVGQPVPVKKGASLAPKPGKSWANQVPD